MMWMALPWFTSELVAVLVTLVATLTFVRRRPSRADDCERAMEELTMRVRTKALHPMTYRLRNWLR